MDVKWVVELIAALMLPIGFGGLMWHRVVTKKSIGARTIQFVAVVMLIPVILVLALENILEATTVGTLIGAFAGYLLSGLSNYDRQQAGNDA